jgi:hypothetical protein
VGFLDAGIAPGEKRAELQLVLHSKEFYRASSLAKLLEYLCEKTITGHTVEIKEFSIATEVFGKDLDFGQRRDSFVRVAVHRLRRKLEHFYETEGAAHRVRIVIKPGKYEPEFEHASETAIGAAIELPAVIEAPVIPAAPPATLPAAPLESVEAPKKVLRWRPAILAVAAILVILLSAKLWSGRKPVTEAAVAHSALAPLAASQTSPAIRILAGSSADRIVDRSGAEWRGDRYYSGGLQDSLRLGNQERSVIHPFILGASDQTPFRSFRAGDFSYRIPAPPGKYELRLYFSEVVFGLGASGEGAENQRLFDVNLNGHPLLTLFDIYTDAGGANTADIRVFENVSPAADGFVSLDFRGARETAWINAIELIPNATGRPQPLRLVAQDNNFIDRAGQVWSSDRYYVGGRATSDGKVPLGTDDPGLYTSQRYGHFSYRLPVPPGKYKLRLLFAETFFGPDNRGKGGAGSRVFNVYCGGAAILRQFDIFKTAGENHVVEKVFHGLEPNSGGRIDLLFEPVANYAVIQAIELTEERPMTIL